MKIKEKISKIKNVFSFKQDFSLDRLFKYKKTSNDDLKNIAGEKIKKKALKNNLKKQFFGFFYNIKKVLKKSGSVNSNKEKKVDNFSDVDKNFFNGILDNNVFSDKKNNKLSFERELEKVNNIEKTEEEFDQNKIKEFNNNISSDDEDRFYINKDLDSDDKVKLFNSSDLDLVQDNKKSKVENDYVYEENSVKINSLKEKDYKINEKNKELGNNVEKGDFKKTNNDVFSNVFRNDSGQDIFEGVLKKKSTISISDNLKNALDEKEKKKDLYSFFNANWFSGVISNLNKYILLLLIFIFSLFLGIYLFFLILFDANNYIYSNVGGYTLGSSIKSLEKDIEKKRVAIQESGKIIEKMAGDVPLKIYLKTPYFESLSEKVKNQLFGFYDNRTGDIKKLTDEKKDELLILFNNNPSLFNLRSMFVKQDVLNLIINNRIYWKSVYKDLMDATNTVFKYNDVIGYVVYNNFSVDSDGKISVSGVVSDPSGKVFSQLFRLEGAINKNEHFSGVSIDNFNKTVNPDENIGGMMTSINLTFNYIK